MARGTTGYRRTRRSAEPPFRAWGLTLFFISAFLAWFGAWVGAAAVGVLLVFYLLAVRLTPCRVETLKHTPCRWLVRGVLGTCNWHRGLKRGLPRLVRTGWDLPRFMWPRGDLAPVAPRAELQPRASAGVVATTAPNAARPAYDWIIMGIEGAGLLIAVVSLMHQVTAG